MIGWVKMAYKNALKEKNFFSYDFSEVITVDTAKDLEDDNKKLNIFNLG